MAVTLTVEGMSCEGCEQTVEDALTTVEGVENAHADRTSNSATIEGDAATDALVDAVNEAGYTAST
jgi:copper chaperone CopZ